MQTVKEWMDSLTEGHTFGKGQPYGLNQGNIKGELPYELELEGKSRERMTFARGVRFCIYATYEDFGCRRLATIFAPGAMINIYPGGVFRRRMIA